MTTTSPATHCMTNLLRLAVLCSSVALGADGSVGSETSDSSAKDDAWETVMDGPLVVKNRAVTGSAIKEVWSEADLDAPARDVQDALMTPSGYHTFMPFLREAREVSERQSDGSVYVYTQIDLPLVGKRDYVTRVWLLHSADAGGTFQSKWTAYPDFLPLQPDVTRLRRNDGSWRVTPIGDGTRCHAVYRFAVEPGGWVPAFAVNLGNQRGVGDTLRGVEKEAKRRYAERLKKAAAASPAEAKPSVVAAP